MKVSGVKVSSRTNNRKEIPEGKLLLKMPLTLFTGVGLYHQQGCYLCLLTYINQTEPWISKRQFSAALTKFPCPNTLGVLLKPWYYIFATCHRTCWEAMCYRVGKSNDFRHQLIFLQRLLLWWAKQCPCWFLRLQYVSFWVQSSENFVCRTPTMCGHSRSQRESKPRDL